MMTTQEARDKLTEAKRAIGFLERELDEQDPDVFVVSTMALAAATALSTVNEAFGHTRAPL